MPSDVGRFWVPAPDGYERGDAVPDGATSVNAANLNARERTLQAAARDVWPDARHLHLSNRNAVGSLMFSKPGDTFAVMWGPGWDPAFVDLQVAAARRLNHTALKVCGDSSGVSVGGLTTLDEYVDRVEIVLQKTRGFLVNLLVTDNPKYLEGARATLEQEVEMCARVCAMADKYPHVMMLNLGNETNGLQANLGGAGAGSYSSNQPNALSKTRLTAMAGAARANTSKPITFSLFTESTAQMTANGANDWWPYLVNTIGVDVLDISLYWTPDTADAQVSDFEALHALYPNLNMVIGESSVPSVDAESAKVRRRIMSLQPIVELPYVVGAFWYTLNDYSAPPGTGLVYGSDLTTERANASEAFRMWPRLRPYATQPGLPLGARFDIPNALTLVPGSTVLLDRLAFDTGEGDPQWRLRGALGPGTNPLVSGDSITAQVVDLDTGDVLGAGTVAVGGASGAATTPDAGGGDAGSLLGSVTFAAAASGYGNAAVFDSADDQVRFTDNFRPEGAQPFTVRFRFKRARTGVAENMASQWKDGGTFLDANWVCGFTAADKPITSWIDGAGDYAELQSTTAVVQDTNWHWFEVTWDGTAVRLFIDGTGVSGVASSRQTGKATQPIILGGVLGDTVGFRGSIDEFEYANIARDVGASYTAPTGPVTADANTKRLAHLDTSTAGSSNVAGSVVTPWAPFSLVGSRAAAVKVRNARGAAGAIQALLEVRSTGRA